MSDSEYSVIKNDVIKRFDCIRKIQQAAKNPEKLPSMQGVREHNNCFQR